MGARYLEHAFDSESLDMLVIAFCKDYGRRKREIEAGRIRRRIIMEYEYLNARVSEAATEIVGDIGETYINEIGNRIGYAKSVVPDISESEYKRNKIAVKLNVARKLHLID